MVLKDVVREGRSECVVSSGPRGRIFLNQDLARPEPCFLRKGFCVFQSLPGSRLNIGFPLMIRTKR